MLRMIINLDRSKDRWQHMLGQMSDLGMDDGDFLRVSAVDGRKLTLEQLDNAAAPLNSPAKADFPGALTNTEIGCFLSHKKCWQQLLASHEGWGRMRDNSEHLRRSLTELAFAADLKVRLHQKFTKQDCPWTVRSLPFPETID